MSSRNEIKSQTYGYAEDGRLIARDDLVGGWTVTNAPGDIKRFDTLDEAADYAGIASDAEISEAEHRAAFGWDAVEAGREFDNSLREEAAQDLAATDHTGWTLADYHKAIRAGVWDKGNDAEWNALCDEANDKFGTEY